MRMKNILHQLYSALVITFIYCSSSISADFTLKGLTSWVKGEKEETYFKEIPFYADGTLILENEFGTVTIKSWSFPKIVIEAVKRAPTKELSTLDIETTLVTNQLFITSHNSSKNSSIDFQIIVPTSTTLVFKGKEGTIKTKNIEGVQHIASNSSVDIQGASNSVQVTTAGQISLNLTRLPAHATISLKSSKSSITVRLPSSCNATLKATTQYSSVISHQPITLKPITLLLNKQHWENLKKSIEGILGNGGATLDIQAYNGITIY